MLACARTSTTGANDEDPDVQAVRGIHPRQGPNAKKRENYETQGRGSTRIKLFEHNVQLADTGLRQTQLVCPQTLAHGGQYSCVHRALLSTAFVPELWLPHHQPPGTGKPWYARGILGGEEELRWLHDATASSNQGSASNTRFCPGFPKRPASAAGKTKRAQRKAAFQTVALIHASVGGASRECECLPPARECGTLSASACRWFASAAL